MWGVFGVTLKLLTPLLTSCAVGLRWALGMVVTGIFSALFTTKDSRMLNGMALTVSMSWLPSSSLQGESVAGPLGPPSLSGIPVPDLPQRWQWLFLW